MFCDVVGSTDRRAAMGEVDADRFFRQVERALRDTVDGWGGSTLKSAGDGIMAVFTAASEAVDAAVALHREVARRGFDLELRVGVAAGDVSWEDGDCFGLPVVVASRLEGACEPGSVLVSAVARHLAGDRADVDYVSVGPLELKGIPDPIEAFAVRWDDERSDVEASRRFPSVLPPAGRFPFVGRAEEKTILLERWDQVRAGGRATVMVGGEAGAGKTRLATEIARLVFQEGAIVLAGVCDTEFSVPYQPWSTSIGELLEQLPGEVLDASTGLLADVHSLVPAVERLGAEVSVVRRDPEDERHRMFRAVAEILRRATEVSPVLLVLDDLHWAGQQTLALMRFVVRAEQIERLLIVGTFRDTGDEITGPLAAALADFRRDERVTRVKLEGIDSAAVRELLAAEGLESQLDLRAAEIAARTGGNPFMVGELAQEVGAGAALSSVPDSVRDVVSGRLQRLSEEARIVSNLVAIGGRVSFPVLRIASDLDANALGLSLVEVVQSGLVQELAGPTPSYQFAHALIRDAVDGGLQQISRAALHEALALAIEQVHEADRRPVLAQLARHFVSAAPLAGWEKAAYYGRRAAAQARRSAAYDEAIELVERTCQVVPSGTRERAQLLVDAADLLQRDGRHPEAMQRADQATEAAAAAGDVELRAEAAMELERAAHLRNTPLERTVTLLSELLDEDELGPVTTARVLASLGRAQWLVGRSTGLATTREALTRTEDMDEESRAHALETAMVVEVEPRKLLAYTEELRDITTRTGDVFQSMWARNRRIYALLSLGRVADARADNVELANIAVDYRLASYEYLGHASASTLALALAEFDEAEAEAEAANVTEHRRFGGIEASGVYGLQMFMIRREQGRLEEMRPVLELLARSNGAIAWKPGLLAAYTELGMDEEAGALFEELAADDLGGLPRDAIWPLTLSFMVEAAVELERTEVAVTLMAELAPYAGLMLTAGYSTCAGPADRLRAIVAAWMGDLDLAGAALADAARLCETSGSPVWSAHVDLAGAYVAQRRGDHAAFVEHARTARERAERHGLEGVILRLERLGAVPGSDEATAPPGSAFPDGLTAREVEVLGLLGRGFTNRVIGERLFISPNTVANHVRRILQKTASANRTEAAAYAVQRGLVDDGGCA